MTQWNVESVDEIESARLASDCETKERGAMIDYKIIMNVHAHYIVKVFSITCFDSILTYKVELF